MLTPAEVRRLRSLREKRHREALGLFAVEGERTVRELLAAGYPFVEVYATDPAALPGPGGGAPRPEARAITREEMARLSHFPTPSGVFAVARLRREPLPAGALDRGLTLALDGVQDPGNVGTILRIADWYGIDRVLLGPDCADVHSPKVVQSSMGSFGRLPIHAADLAAALADVRVPVIGCDLAGGDVHRFAAPRDAVVVIGSEGRGLSAPVAARLTLRLTIPRYGGGESLNAAVAAAVVCDNLRRTGPPGAGPSPA
jgi:TrmH family RNA methyltransferase